MSDTTTDLGPKVEQLAVDLSKKVRDEIFNGSAAKDVTTSLLDHAESLSERVVLVTGAASGFGRAFSLKAAKYGAKLVLGDLNEKGLDAVNKQIAASGGVSIGIKTDVTDWDSQYKLFELAISKFGRIDVVIPNAGVGEIDRWMMPRVTEDGRLKKPRMTTLEVNMIGVCYTVKLGSYFLDQNPIGEDGVRGRIVLIGSMASFYAIPLGSQYTAAKHGVFGLYKSIYYECLAKEITVSILCPWFVDTDIMEFGVRILLAGVPKAKIEDVVNSLICGSTTTDSGNIIFVDIKGVVSLPHASFEARSNDCVYGLLDTRALVQRSKSVAKITDILLTLKKYSKVTVPVTVAFVSIFLYPWYLVWSR